MKIPVASLETCARVRVRKNKPRSGSDVVQDYAEAYECGLITEPLDVFREKGTERYIVADGEHRLAALQRAKIESVECRLHEGDEIAALDFAIGRNQAHGLRRTKADKYHAFERIMETPALRRKYRTDTDLSEKVGVSIRTIASYKALWRQSDSTSKRAAEAKRRAKESADRHTDKGQISEPATCRFENSTESTTNEFSDDTPFLGTENAQSSGRKRKPKTQDQKHEAEAQSAIDTTRHFPHDGREGARRWANISTDHARYMRDFWAEFVAEREDV